MTGISAAILAVMFPILSAFGTLGGPGSGATASTVRRAVVFAIDTSGYMAGERLEAVVREAQGVVAAADSQTALGVVAFSGRAVVVQPLTTDKGRVVEALGGLTAGGTRALYKGAALAVALAAEAGSEAERVVLLVTSGWEHTARVQARRGEALALARATGVVVHTLSVGKRADVTFLSGLAAGSGGKAYAAAEVTGIGALYRATAQALFGRPTTADGGTALPVGRAAGDGLSKPGGEVVAVKAVGPGRADEPQVAAVERAALVVALDVSGPMRGERLEAARAALAGLAAGVGERLAVGLVTFGSRTEVALALTTDRTAVAAALDGLAAGGRRELYAGVNAAIKLAASADAAARAVLVLNSGWEYSDTSTARRGEALALAQAGGVVVHTLALGERVDMDYLRALAEGTGGQQGVAVQAAELAAAAERLLTPYLAGAAASSAGAAPGGTGPAIPPLGGQPLPVVAGSVTEPTAAGAAPLDRSGAPLIPALPGSLSVAAPGGAPASGAAERVTPPQSAPVAQPLQAAVANRVAIDIQVADSLAVRAAELAVNGYRLSTFAAPPFHYELDTSALEAGQYTLSFTLVTAGGVTSTGEVNFEVTLDAPVQGGVTPRRLLLDGVERAFRFTFSPETGLALAAAEPLSAAPTAGESLLDILARPASLLPEPVRAALSAQRPRLWSIVMLVLTLVLLPQGLFTLYYMLYTWNNPRLAARYRSPQTFEPPQLSFTALVPARREQAVLYQTLQAIDRVNYPDHLKEVLVLIRDEDDDATIAEARRAIADLGKDHIKLITFTDGPKNKPNGLNKGLRAATKDVVTVFDAEDEPHPELYNIINTVMLRDQADVVQSGVQLMNFTSTWFAALNCLEYFFWFKSGLHAFTRALGVTPLGGNTVFFKRAWLERLGGWDDHCLTEDADIGLRLTRLGARIQIVYDEQHVTQEETPATAESFIKQRTRWNQGFYEVFVKGDWLRLPTLKQKLTALYILLNSLLQAAIVLYAPVGLYVALTQRIPVPIALFSYLPIFMLLTQAVVNLVGIREFCAAYRLKLPFAFSLKLLLVYYPYQLMLALAAFRAVGRFLARKNAWEKTTHANLHRQPAPANSSV